MESEDYSTEMQPFVVSGLLVCRPRPVRIGFALVWLLLLGTALRAQESRELTELYRNNNMETLQELHRKGDIRDRGWREFVAALFEEDAERAVQQMLNAYPHTADRNLQRFIRERVSLFYSSRGYYETARKILEDRSFMERVVSMNTARQERSQEHTPVTRSGDPPAEQGGNFGIQVGAFSTLDNAQRASRIYRRYYANTRILEKEKDRGVLYIVVIGDYPNRAAAEDALPKINNQFNLNGYIIQY